MATEAVVAMIDKYGGKPVKEWDAREIGGMQ